MHLFPKFYLQFGEWDHIFDTIKVTKSKIVYKQIWSISEPGRVIGNGRTVHNSGKENGNIVFGRIVNNFIRIIGIHLLPTV